MDCPSGRRSRSTRVMRSPSGSSRAHARRAATSSVRPLRWRSIRPTVVLCTPARAATSSSDSDRRFRSSASASATPRVSASPSPPLGTSSDRRHLDAACHRDYSLGHGSRLASGVALGDRGLGGAEQAWRRRSSCAVCPSRGKGGTEEGGWGSGHCPRPSHSRGPEGTRVWWGRGRSVVTCRAHLAVGEGPLRSRRRLLGGA